MFEAYTYEYLLSDALANAPPEIDTRQGSIFYDAVSSNCFKIAQYYADLSSVFDLVFLDTAADEYLDRKGAEYQVFRNQSTPAKYEYAWAGAGTPETGTRFFTDGLYFVLRAVYNLYPYLEAEIPGSACNDILEGTPAVPVNNIDGLVASAFGALIEPGADTEKDDDYRNRIREKIAGPAENGNRQHYKTWCEDVDGVGRARIIPLFAGPNTVMGIIIDTDGLPATAALISRVQKYVDPVTQDLSVEFDGATIPIGDGLGDGVANLGAHFAAVSPAAVSFDVSFSVELQEGATTEQIRDAAIISVTSYFKNLTLTAPERQDVVVRISAISSLLYAIPGLIDYTNLTINGNSANVELSDTQVAVLGEVTVNAFV